MEEGKKVAWNLSEGLIRQIDLLLQASSVNYVGGKFATFFENLKAVRMKIIQSLTPGERQQFKTLETETYSYLDVLASLRDPRAGFENPAKIRAWYIESKPKLILALDKYNDLLMDTLDKYGYLIPPKEDKTKMSA